MERRRILLIRHGQTQWNVEGRWQGVLATSLNTNGFAQARALARALRTRPITAIYTSDLQRAVQTATVLGSVFKLTPIEDARWREGVSTFRPLRKAGLRTGDPLSARPDLFPLLWTRA